MWKEYIALHLHVNNSGRLHQAEPWMISFFDIATKKKKAGFLPRKFEGATHFMGEKIDQDIINDIAQVGEFWGIEIGSLVDPLETETSERSNGPSSMTKKVTRNFRRRCASIALRLTSCLIPYGMGWS